MPACIEEGEERKQILTFLLWWPKLSLHTKTFIFTFLDLRLFSPTYFSIDKTSIFTIHTPESTSESGSLYYTSRQTKAQCSLEDFHCYFINHQFLTIVKTTYCIYISWRKKKKKVRLNPAVKTKIKAP